ncbi:MAG: hypothetical protein ACREDE_01170 [Thermoplasmata archaeon]
MSWLSCRTELIPRWLAALSAVGGVAGIANPFTFFIGEAIEWGVGIVPAIFVGCTLLASRPMPPMTHSPSEGDLPVPP